VKKLIFVLTLVGMTLVGLYFSLSAWGSTYLLPPDVDDLRLSSKAKLIYTVSHNARTDTYPFLINLNGSLTTVLYDCVRVEKINCKMGIPVAYYSLGAYQAYEKKSYADATYQPAKVNVVDVRTIDQGDSWLYCMMMGTTNGNALLTDHDTPDAAGNPGAAYDPYNPSFIKLYIVETCK